MYVWTEHFVMYVWTEHLMEADLPAVCACTGLKLASMAAAPHTKYMYDLAAGKPVGSQHVLQSLQLLWIYSVSFPSS